MQRNPPLVSVLTPVYNGADFLEECIESVLRQTYTNYEYIIVNNCSTDRTLDIASRYARQDSRIRVHSNDEFVPVIANHNIAFNLMSPEATYCKVVSADDFLFPECLTRLVECCEANPSVGIVGCYQLSGAEIRWQGFDYPRTVIPGLETGRRAFLNADKKFGFGSPTSLMYRSDLVRATEEFYPNASPHADTSACFEQLSRTDFGFVFQVLSYERKHEGTQSRTSEQLNCGASAALNDILQYGRRYLNPQEWKEQVDSLLHAYHRYLAANYLFESREDEFWTYHKSRLAELGYPLRPIDLLKGVLRELRQPVLAMRKMSKRLSASRALRSSRSEIHKAPAKRIAMAGHSRENRRLH
jgi:glycosyltransferase involved in cell wall biosynthesis